MKVARTLALAAVVLAALLDVGSASAEPTFTVELCKANETPCLEKNFYSEKTKISAKATKVEFIGETGTVSCEKSTIEGETTGPSGAPLTLYIETMTFSGCLLGKTKCTVSSVHLPYYGHIEQTAEGKDSGTFNLSNWGNGNASTSIECSGLVECTLTEESVNFNVKGGEKAAIETTKAELKKESGAACLKSMSLTAQYTVESPAPLHLTSLTTKLCTTTANASDECNITYEDSLAATLLSAAAKFSTTLGTVSCSEMFLGSEFYGGAIGDIFGMYFKSAGLCSSTINAPANPGVEVLLEGMPYFRTHFTFLSFTNANKAILQVGGQPVLKLKIELPTSLVCTYSARQANWAVTAYAPLKMKAQWYWIVLAGNPAGCPGNAQLEAESSMKRSTDGGNVWVTR